MKYIINAFSPKMLKKNDNSIIQVENIFKTDVEKYKDECISAVGHWNIAEHLEIKRNRMSIILEKGDTAYVVESKLINNQENYNYKKITIT